MPSNPESQSVERDGEVRLDGWSVLQVGGKDAADFLQRQTMNDIAALQAPGDLHWNGLLSAKGRVLALFLCLRSDDQTFLLLAPDRSAEELNVLLQRYVLRSKIALTVREELAAYGSWKDVDQAPTWGVLHAAIEATGASVTLPGALTLRTLRLRPESSASAPDPEASARWQLDDLRCGLPRLSADQSDKWTAHMLGLERLAAFSLKKGCYPGQEIIARTHYLGRSKRRLLRVDAESAIPDDSLVVSASGVEVGNTICKASWRNHHSALMVCSLDPAANETLLAGAVRVHPADFSVESLA